MCLSFIRTYYIDQNKFELLKDPIKPTIILIWKIQTHRYVVFFHGWTTNLFQNWDQTSRTTTIVAAFKYFTWF